LLGYPGIVYGYPDLFLTITCNPKWVEIERHLSMSGNYASFRPYICCRVFHLKLQEMMSDFRKGEFFGKVIASELGWNKMCLTLPLESFDDNKVLQIVNWIC